jgi:CheY-like chemotaxis protein
MIAADLNTVSGLCEAAILLVEDDELSQMIAIAMLRQLGYVNVTTADNGGEALRACVAAEFHLILMDCQMPVMDGPEATRAIRARGIRTPIIAFTASESPKVRLRCMEAGMNDCLTKPAHLDLMGERVRHWLGSSAPAKLTRGPAPSAPSSRLARWARSAATLLRINHFEASFRKAQGRAAQ